MTTQEDEWLNVKKLYTDALEKSEAERVAFVEENTPPHSALRAEVFDLLGYSNEAESFFSNTMEELVGKENLAIDDKLDDQISDPYNLVGKEFSHYKIIKQLGQGSMGILYQAFDTRLERTIALKFLTPSGGSAVTRKRMLREARLACSLDHHNVGVIHDIGQTKSGHDYIAMGYYDGVTLDKLIEQQTLTLDQVVNIGIQIAAGLAAIHEKNVVHCDIKPSNIMVCQNDRVVILDFGVAKLRNVDLTDSQSRLGTVSYMSPEHIRGEEVDACSDVWSLGVVLYEMLAGARPFAGTNPEAIFYALLHSEIADIPSTIRGVAIPSDLSKLVMACLIRDKKNRISSCKILHSALLQYKNATLDLSYMTMPTESLSFSRRKRWVVTAIVSLLLVFSGSFISSFLFDNDISSIFSDKLPQEKYIVVLTKNSDPSKTSLVLEGLMASVTNRLKLIERVQEDFGVISAEEAKRVSGMDLKSINLALGANLILLLDSSEDGENIELNLSLVNAINLQEVGQKTIMYPKRELTNLNTEILGASLELLEFENSVNKRKKLSSVNTSSVEALSEFLKGLAFLQRPDDMKSLDSAISSFKSAIEIDPEYANAYSFLGKAYWHKYSGTDDNKWLEDANQNLQKSLTINGNEISTYHTLGLVNVSRGNYGSAIAAFNIMLADSENNIDAILGLARTHQLTNQFKKSEGYFIQATAFQPNNWQVHNSFGVFLAQTGRLEEAVLSFKTAIKLTPENTRVNNNLANTYWYLEDFESAEKYYNLSINIQPNFDAYSLLATTLFYRKRYKEAYDLCEKAIKLNKSGYRTWGLMAESAHFAKLSASEIISALNNAIRFAEVEHRLNPNDLSLTLDLASFYAQKGDSEKSLKLVSSIKIASKRSPRISFSLGVVYEMLGERKAAVNWINKAFSDGHAVIEIKNNPWLDRLLLDPSLRT